MHVHHDGDTEDHDKGLVFDLQTLDRRARRRDVLKVMAIAGLVSGVSSLLSACGGSSADAATVASGTGSSGSSTSGTGTSGTGTSGTGTSGTGTSTGGTSGTGTSGTGTTTGGDGCSVIPNETEGPFPGDGSNGPNALSTSGVMRSDIRTSFGGLSGTAAGIPMVIELTLTNANAGCALLEGYAIYLWHCDQQGQYSMYDVPSQNYLRGVQVTDSFGVVTFTSIFPACYQGRWPHIHFEVFPSLASTSSAGNKVRTSQIALPSSVCSAVYATSGYETSQNNFSRVSLQTDNVFGDGADLQIPVVEGNVSDGYVVSLQVGIGV